MDDKNEFLQSMAITIIRSAHVIASIGIKDPTTEQINTVTLGVLIIAARLQAKINRNEDLQKILFTALDTFTDQLREEKLKASSENDNHRS